jgi:hypothetical protein
MAKRKVGKKSDGLTKRQEDTMKSHSEHHTKKHMDMMRSLMIKGDTFGQAHKKAMRKVGK